MVISQIRQAFPMVRINVTNLIFDENIHKEHGSVDGGNLEGEMHTTYGDHTAAEDPIINHSIMPQSSTAPQATNSDDRLVCTFNI